LAQHPIEIILLRQWASYVVVPIWIIDPDGNLIYCNESAEDVTGIHFDEEGDAPVETYATRFDICDLDGSPLMTEDIPIAIAQSKQIPAHRVVQIRDLNGTWRKIETTAIPLVGQGGRQLGAMAMFWEVNG
jgi:PAS domain-containing protein